jgi:hypothetical protein
MVGGRRGCVYGTKGAVDRKRLGTTAVVYKKQTHSLEKMNNF